MNYNRRQRVAITLGTWACVGFAIFIMIAVTGLIVLAGAAVTIWNIFTKNKLRYQP